MWATTGGRPYNRIAHTNVTTSHHVPIIESRNEHGAAFAARNDTQSPM